MLNDSLESMKKASFSNDPSETPFGGDIDNPYQSSSEKNK
jgi:hypothetical protein